MVVLGGRSRDKGSFLSAWNDQREKESERVTNLTRPSPAGRGLSLLKDAQPPGRPPPSLRGRDGRAPAMLAEPHRSVARLLPRTTAARLEGCARERGERDAHRLLGTPLGPLQALPPHGSVHHASLLPPPLRAPLLRPHRVCREPQPPAGCAPRARGRRWVARVLFLAPGGKLAPDAVSRCGGGAAPLFAGQRCCGSGGRGGGGVELRVRCFGSDALDWRAELQRLQRGGQADAPSRVAEGCPDLRSHPASHGRRRRCRRGDGEHVVLIRPPDS
mmetsp:Transcript_67675/g.161949  ORF Transcript_67675/g.161949 Transcript_67675/m.161949 type:complete len:274 (+) Transcript_67675:2090-2911(+)